MPQLKAISHYNRQALRISSRGNKDDALGSLACALRLSRELDNTTLEAFSKHNMGVVYERAGQPEHAAICFRIALEIADLAPLQTKSVRRVIERSMNSLVIH